MSNRVEEPGQSRTCVPCSKYGVEHSKDSFRYLIVFKDSHYHIVVRRALSMVCQMLMHASLLSSIIKLCRLLRFCGSPGPSENIPEIRVSDPSP